MQKRLNGKFSNGNHKMANICVTGRRRECQNGNVTAQSIQNI